MLVDFLGYALLFSAVMVVVCYNQIHALFYLISVFILLMLSLLVGYDTEFLAFLLIIVYIGAIAILFLFVVMMLDANVPSPLSKVNFFNASFLVFLLTGVVFFSIFNESFNTVFFTDYISFNSSRSSAVSLWLDIDTVFSLEGGDLRELSKVLYTVYSVPFLLSAYILFIAMLGAISLTLKHKSFVKRQDLYIQTNRQFGEAIKLYD